MKKLMLFGVVLSLVVAAAAAGSGDKGITGWIVDDKCGVKAANASALECTKKCLEAGAKPVLVTDADKTVLNISNPDAVKEHWGHHVAVEGKVDSGSIQVQNVRMIAAKTGDKHEHGEKHEHKEKH